MKTFFSTTIRLFSLALCIVFVAGCGLLDSVDDDIANSVNNVAKEMQIAITKLQKDSGAWMVVLQELQHKIDADVSDLVKNELTNLMKESIAAAEEATQCVVDQLGMNIIANLQYILANFVQMQSNYKIEPVICGFKINTLDLNTMRADRELIAVAGFNFLSSMSFSVLLKCDTVYQYLPANSILRVSRYKLMIDLTEIDDDVLDKYKSLILRTPTEECELKINKKVAPPKETKEIKLDALNLTFVPPHTRGDKEFAGHGPEIEVKIKFFTSRGGGWLNPRQEYFKVTVYMKATETCGDYTTVDGSQTTVLYTAPAGWHITKVTNAKNWVPSNYVTIYHQTDTNLNDDTVYTHFGSLTVIGDTAGIDAGDTRVDISITDRSCFFVITIEQN